MEQCRRANIRSEEELLKRQALEKKRLPKQQKADAKTRALMFRQSLKIGPNQLTMDQERERIRQVGPVSKLPNTYAAE